MPTIAIQLPTPPAAAYDVQIEPNLLSHLGPIVRSLAPAPTAGLVSDSQVAPLYLQKSRAALESAGYRVIPFIFPAGESSKNITTAVAALDTLLNAKVERSTPILALGGGVVGDLTGFVAATLLRGVPFIQIPTTLLAAVDASVGGKVGIDHPAGKNLIGAFHQPQAVLTDISTFATLPIRELRCGLAECIKHAIIRDPELFTFIDSHAEKLLHRDPALLADLVARNVRIKAAIVQQDPYEQNVRALLNLGHTFGHALEAVSNFQNLQHGEAVALGTVAASNLAVQLNLIDAPTRDRIQHLFQKVGLPTTLPIASIDAVFAAMATDKKVRAGKLRLVLPTKLGDAQVFDNVAPEKIRQAIASLNPSTS